MVLKILMYSPSILQLLIYHITWYEVWFQEVLKKYGENIKEF